MLSKTTAFVLVAAACVVAAGGGAYIATWQHQRATTAVATTPAGPATQTASEPASQAAGQAQPPAVEPAQTTAEAAEPAAAVPAPRERTVAAKEVEKRPAPAARAPKAKPAIAAATKPAAAPMADVNLPAPPTPAPQASPAAAVDSGSQAQRPSPALPAPLVPVIIDPAADQSKADQSALPPSPEKQWQEVVVPAESVLGLQLESSVSSETAQVEDRVDARVTRDVRVGRLVAIPAGTRATGSVVLVERGGRVKGRARLGIRFTTLILPDTTRLTVDTETIYREGESPAGQSSAKIGGATIGGAIIGAILGGGKGAAIGTGIGAAGGTAAALAGDRIPVELPAGTALSVRIGAPINMTVEK